MLGTLFGFKGRLSRVGFVEALVSIALIDAALILAANYLRQYGLPIEGYGPRSGPVAAVMGQLHYLPLVLGVLTTWALLATAVKRCHDRNRTGWLLLLGFIIVFGWLWLLVDLFILGGTRGANRYGRQPHSHEPDRTWEPEAPIAAAAAIAAAPEAAHGHGDHAHADTDAEDHGHGHADAHAPADDHGHAPAHGHDSDHDHGHADDHGDHHGHGHAEAQGHDDDHGHGHVDAHVDDHGHGHADDHGHVDHGHAAAHATAHAHA